jgi:hypothetical protein
LGVTYQQRQSCLLIKFKDCLYSFHYSLVILECKGVGQVIGEWVHTAAASGVVCLTGVGHGGAMPKIATADIASAAVLKNMVVVGSVNAN